MLQQSEYTHSSMQAGIMAEYSFSSAMETAVLEHFLFQNKSKQMEYWCACKQFSKDKTQTCEIFGLTAVFYV